MRFVWVTEMTSANSGASFQHVDRADHIARQGVDVERSCGRAVFPFHSAPEDYRA